MSKLFNDLKESIQDAGKFLRGEEVRGLTLHTVSIRPLEAKSSNELREIREKLHLSQGALAEILGVSRKTIEAWEHSGAVSKPALRILQLLEINPSNFDSLIEYRKKTG